MAKLKLKVTKSKRYNPVSEKMGYSARVITNGTADYDDIASLASRNTTVHRAELKASFELCMETAAEMLKQGYIVDLGPIGKIYPSCSSGWFEKAEDLTMESVKPALYFHPADEVAAAIKGASLVWAKAGEEEEEDGTATTGDDSGGGTTSGSGDNSGGTTPGGGDDNSGDGME